MAWEMTIEGWGESEARERGAIHQHSIVREWEKIASPCVVISYGWRWD